MLIVEHILNFGNMLVFGLQAIIVMTMLNDVMTKRKDDL